jgi:hypothetical protein
VLLVVGAVLLAARDLWSIQADAVGGILRFAGVTHEVVTDPDRLAQIRLGDLTRDGEARAAHAPIVGVPAPDADRPTTSQTVALLAFAAAACAAMAFSRRLPGPAKGFVFVVLVVMCGTAAYAAWWSPLPPLDVRALVVDWRTSALAPICGLALLFAYDLYPLPGSFVVKTFWVLAAMASTAVFSTVRLALVAAGYAEFGASSFLALHHVAGTFWDLAPGIAVLAAGHASLALSLRAGRRIWFLP